MSPFFHLCFLNLTVPFSFSSPISLMPVVFYVKNHIYSDISILGVFKKDFDNCYFNKTCFFFTIPSVLLHAFENVIPRKGRKTSAKWSLRQKQCLWTPASRERLKFFSLWFLHHTSQEKVWAAQLDHMPILGSELRSYEHTKASAESFMWDEAGLIWVIIPIWDMGKKK